MITRPKWMPASSQTSRRVASSIDSAGSQKPARVEYQYFGKRLLRPSSSLSPAWLTTATMMVGSVRGKERLETPFLVAQAGRSMLEAGVLEVERAVEGRAEESVGGQVRLKPPFTERVGWPH